MSLGGVRATVSIALASEINVVSNMDKYCIIVMCNLFPGDRHVFILVGLIFFRQQNSKEKGVFSA